MRLWVIALISAAGLGMAAEEAFADRGRGNHSSAHRHHHAQRHHPHARPHHHHRPHAHHHHYRPSYRLGFWAAPVVVAPPLYYYSPPVTTIERPQAPPPVVPSLNSGYWYFCPDNRLYYPHAVECPSGWLRVAPN